VPDEAEMIRMYETITIEEAQARLAELIRRLNPGEEVVITEDDQPVAKLTRQPAGQWPCQPGSAKNTPHWMAPDFDAPLDDFKEYSDKRDKGAGINEAHGAFNPLLHRFEFFKPLL